MMRIILIALLVVLPVLYYLIYFARKKLEGNHVKISDYKNLKIFTILLVIMFICYIILLVFRLQEFSGEGVKPARYVDGKIVGKLN